MESSPGRTDPGRLALGFQHAAELRARRSERKALPQPARHSLDRVDRLESERAAGSAAPGEAVPTISVAAAAAAKRTFHEGMTVSCVAAL